MNATMSQVIESRSVVRDYGFAGTEMIVDHPTHGRLLLCDGFGGTDDLRGGAVRWEHGAAYHLLPGDTFESLDSGEWNGTTNLLAAVKGGHDSSRPVLVWDGIAIKSLATSAE